MSDTAEPAWVTDPDRITFVTAESTLREGEAELHGLGEKIGNLFSRSKEDVKAELSKTFDQMHFLLDSLTPSAHGYEASEVTFELAFSASGKVGFIAEAGIESSISVTFTRNGREQAAQS